MRSLFPYCSYKKSTSFNIIVSLSYRCYHQSSVYLSQYGRGYMYVPYIWGGILSVTVKDRSQREKRCVSTTATSFSILTTSGPFPPYSGTYFHHFSLFYHHITLQKQKQTTLYNHSFNYCIRTSFLFIHNNFPFLHNHSFHSFPFII